MTLPALHPRRVELGPVLARLNALRPLSPDEADLIGSLGTRAQAVPAGAVLLEEEAPIGRALYVLSGWACRQQTLSDGRRQILSFLLPGDGAGLCTRPRPLAITTTLALTPVVLVDAERLLSETCPVARGLRDVLELAAAADERRLIALAVRLGRQTAYERFCSLLIELVERWDVIRPEHGSRYELPITQEILADALGLSVVHVNRTIQQVRRANLIQMRSGTLRILDRAALERASGRS